MTVPAALLRAKPALAAVALALGLAGCSAAERLAEIGERPGLSGINNPQAQPGYRPVSLPMPAPIVAERQPNSLWRAGSRAFFKDQRAGRVGDILTVIINLNERAAVTNTTTRGRTNTETNNIRNLFGFQTYLNDIFPEAINSNNTGGANSAGNIIDLGSTSNNRGTGQITRQDQVNLRVAALVNQLLPNGNMVISGRQEVRVNFEVRELLVAGVIRPEDISAQNTINYDQIAEARVSYGGRGQLSDLQQPRYGSQLLDIILPF